MTPTNTEALAAELEFHGRLGSETEQQAAARRVKRNAMAAAELRRLSAVEVELERERMRLTACGVVALSDTPASAAVARDMHPDYRSASCDDVARRVDECISLRAENAALQRKLQEQALQALTDSTENAELLAERDALRAALLRVLDTREREAKAYLTAQVASENFSRRSAKADEHAHLQAAMEASKAEKEARELLAAMKGTQA